MTRHNLWETIDIDGMEVRFTHDYRFGHGDTTVTLMGTIELDGAWHHLVATVIDDGLTVDQLSIERADKQRVTAWASQGAREFTSWAANTYRTEQLKEQALATRVLDEMGIEHKHLRKGDA